MGDGGIDVDGTGDCGKVGDGKGWGGKGGGGGGKGGG